MLVSTPALARLLAQRSQGHVHLRMARDGVAILRESGGTKVRVPRGSHEAILINTSGGLAGGDTVSIAIDAAEGATLTVTTQAAERVYRTLGPAAEVDVKLQADAGSTLLWLPQETIFFEGSALSRRLDVTLAMDATFIGLESLVFGRQAMGEVVSRVAVSDRWQVRQGGKLIHAEAFRLGPDWIQSLATLGDHRAAATLLMVAPNVDQHLDRVREALGTDGAASAWNGKLVARLLARDGFSLRKALIRAMHVCIGAQGLPRCWTF
jgi:urease accessory protein